MYRSIVTSHQCYIYMYIYHIYIHLYILYVRYIYNSSAHVAVGLFLYSFIEHVYSIPLPVCSIMWEKSVGWKSACTSGCKEATLMVNGWRADGRGWWSTEHLVSLVVVPTLWHCHCCLHCSSSAAPSMRRFPSVQCWKWRCLKALQQSSLGATSMCRSNTRGGQTPSFLPFGGQITSFLHL